MDVLYVYVQVKTVPLWLDFLLLYLAVRAKCTDVQYHSIGGDVALTCTVPSTDGCFSLLIILCPYSCRVSVILVREQPTASSLY